MGCFVVPAAEAVVTTVVTKVVEKKEREALEKGLPVSEFNKEKFSSKLKRLNGLLWGGSGLLAFEHLWHGEIQPFFPFLTAAENPGELTEVFHEMSTVGVGMAVLVTGIWAVMAFVLDSKTEKSEKGKELV